MDPVNTRSEKRRHLFYYLKVFRTDTGELLGNLVDLSHSGVMILSRRPVEVGLEFEIRIEPMAPELGHAELRMTVQSRWHRKDVNPEYFVTGFQVTAMPPEQAAVIDHLIADYGFQG
jgi:hypothetical protein